MKFQYKITAILAAVLATTVAGSQAVTAQTQSAAAARIKAGMVIKHPSGAEVGTVKSVQGDSVILTTGQQEVRLPAASFTFHQGHLLFAMTREQLHAQLAAAQAQAAQQLVLGAVVRGSAGATVGTIEKIEPPYITLKLVSGKLVRLPEAAVAPGASGLMIGMTAVQLESAAGAAGGA
jgi:hypothetical protein